MRRKTWLAQVGGLLLSCFLFAQGGAEAPSQSKETTTFADPSQLEAFVDGVMAAQFEAYRLVGGVVSIVHQGRILLAKGYGWADLARKRKADPDRSLFQIGSVSKLFIWTAVMQLVEEQKLDLEADVNQYLTSFKIPDAYAHPIRLKHLLSHTAGFEDRVIGLFGRSAADLRPLQEVLIEAMPARVRPPGELASYSNYGTALAAHIVSLVSGLPWERYVEERILKPLGMDHSTPRQPVPDHLSSHLSQGYAFQSDVASAGGFEYIPLAPAGAVRASAADMARFMLAQLQMGQLGDAQILQRPTAELMRQPLFRHAPGVNAMLHGYMQRDRGGHMALGHGGDTIYFHSDLVLLPESATGIFVSFNSVEGASARSQLVRAVLDRFFPIPEEAPANGFSTTQAQGLERFAGVYSPTRVPQTTLAKISSLLSAIPITLDEEGLLRLPTGGRIKRFVPEGRLSFRQIDGDERLVFRQDEEGRISHLFLDSFPPIAFVRLGALETPALHWGVLAASLTVLISAAVLWPSKALSRRRQEPSVARPRPDPPAPRLAAWLMCALFGAFFAGLALQLSRPERLVFGVSAGLEALLWLPIAAAVLMPVVLYFVSKVWAGRYWTALGRLHYTLVALAGLVLLAWLHHWNLLGFHY